MALLAAASASRAAEARRPFAIVAKTYSEALIDLALQGDISLMGAAACGPGVSRPLRGVYTVREALDRVLLSAPCGYRLAPDGQTVRIVALTAQPRTTPVSALTPLSELRVTARRRVESLDDLPAGVSVVPGEQLGVSGAADVRETAGQLVGVVMTNLGPGRDKLLMRGLSDGAFTGRARSTVATYLDDSPLNYNAPNPDLRLVDIERVEAVRGPQGSLYGSGALSGVYRIVTRKPDLDTFHAAAGATAAWTEGGSPSREIDGMMNLPLVGGRVALRVVGYHDRLGGYVDDVALSLSNVDQTIRSGARAALRIDLDGAWNLDLSGAVQRLRSNDTQYTTPMLGPRRRANRVREDHDNDFAQAAVNLKGMLDQVEVTSTTSWVRHDYGSRYDASSALGLFSPGADEGVYSELARSTSVTQDLLLASRGEHPVGWLVGLFASTARERTPSLLRARTGTPSSLTTVYWEERSDRRSEVAIYGEVSWTFAPGWTVAAGARAYQIRRRTLADITAPTIPGATRKVNRRQRFVNVSPKLSLQYQFPTGALVYGLYSEGYRAGGANSAGIAPFRGQLDTFQADRLRNFEIGAKRRLFAERLSLRAAAFYDIWTDIQSDQFRPSGLPFTANVGDAAIQGIEAEAVWRSGFGLILQANGMIAHPHFTQVNPDFASRLGAYLPGAPRSSAGVSARYDRPITSGLTLRLTADVNYVGRSRLTFDPMLSPTMGGVVMAKLAASVAGDHWTLGVFVTNPANASGDTFAYGNPFSFGQVRQVTPQRPRTIGVRLAAAL